MSGPDGAIKSLYLSDSPNGLSTNLAELFDNVDKVRHSIRFREALGKLENKINETFKYLESKTEREIQEFIIGKTYANSADSDTFFDIMEINSWTLKGIRDRWRYYKKDLHYDGLVVIACIELNTIPENVRDIFQVLNMDQETYTICLEQRLIQHFLLEEADKRIRNQSFDIGKSSTNPHDGGIVYVAYKLKPKGDGTDAGLENDTKSTHKGSVNKSQENPSSATLEEKPDTIDDETQSNTKQGNVPKESSPEQ